MGVTQYLKQNHEKISFQYFVAVPTNLTFAIYLGFNGALRHQSIFQAYHGLRQHLRAEYEQAIP